MIENVKKSGDYRTESGTPTTATDESRLLWYGHGRCGYWTDDWSKLVLVGPGIPACPHCQSVGFQTTAKKWFDGAVVFERKGNPHYQEFLNQNKETCFVGQGGFMRVYQLKYQQGKKE